MTAMEIESVCLSALKAPDRTCDSVVAIRERPEVGSLDAVL